MNITRHVQLLLRNRLAKAVCQHKVHWLSLIIHFMTDIKNVSRLLNSCSNNLNQYVTLAHETGSIYTTDIEDLNERLTEINQQFRIILKGFVKLLSMADDGV